MSSTRIDIAHLTSAEVVRSLADVTGPVLSAVVPVNRDGVRRPEGPARLRSMLDAMARRLEGFRTDGHPLDRSTRLLLLEAVAQLAENESVWGERSGSVVSTVTSAQLHTFWTSANFNEGYRVSPMAPLRFLLSAVVEAPDFNLLDLSLGVVRLRVPDADRLVDVATPTVPASIDEALGFEDHERRLTNHTAGTNGGHDMRFHGHGVGGEVDHDRIERFIRAVVRGLEPALREIERDQLPLVVTGVAEHLPVLRRMSSIPTILEAPRAISFSDDEREVVTDIQTMLRHGRTTLIEATINHFVERRGTGMTTEGADSSLEAARAGRVATALIERCRHLDDFSDESARIDDLIAEVWRTGGEVVITEPASLGRAAPCACLLRY
ncbi:MAG: hypothetical protein O3C33_07295 [Actinomycetota bacterium]|nr:hypothetical protein [Actinomycetota bacterium]